MSLKDRIAGDIGRTFMRKSHFASVHKWNGKDIVCVIDNEEALKRKNNNVVDISWDNNKLEMLMFVPVDQLMDAPQPNEHIMLDKHQMRVISCTLDGGVYAIHLSAEMTRSY